MQKIFKYINAVIIILLVTILGACGKQNIPVEPASSAFSAMLKGNTSFSAVGGKDTIAVKGGTDGWWVTLPDNDWVVISKRFGSGDFNLPLTVKPNTTNQAREITVIINPTFDLPPVSIIVKQSN